MSEKTKALDFTQAKAAYNLDPGPAQRILGAYTFAESIILLECVLGQPTYV